MSRLTSGRSALYTGLILLLAAISALWTLDSVAASQQRVAQTLAITALSTDPDLVTGGDVLLQIALPENTRTSSVKVRLGQRDLTSIFRAGAAPHTLEGVVTGLTLGKQTIAVTAGN